MELCVFASLREKLYRAKTQRLVSVRTYFFILNIILICWLSAGNMLHAQVIKGRITDANNSPVSNASLFIRELKLGTAANEEGYYELKVEEGTYTCIFQCMGYETETHVITVGSGVTERHIALREKAYTIREVVISSRREDPAYAIMRRAIAMAPYFMNQVSEYQADVYLKGTLQVGKISALVKRLVKSTEGEEIPFKEGNTYLEESFNEIEFTAPNKYRQKVIKKTGSLMGDNSSSNNALSLINLSLYDEKAFASMQIISPLSTSAFSHYRFRYEGFIEENDRIINKIKITPVRKSKQLLSGYIYIVDNFWNIHSADLSGEFIMGITFNMQVNFGDVNDNVWMPVSYRFFFDASILGNKGSFNYVSSVKYNSIVENTSIRKPDALLLAEQQYKAMLQRQALPAAVAETNAAASKTSAKIDDLLEKENLSNRQSYQLARLMQKEAETEKKENQSLDISAERGSYRTTVDSAANQRDTAFWETMRPVPLNPDELKSYQERDARLAGPPKPKDSTAIAKKNKPKSPFMRVTGEILLGTDIKLGKEGKWGRLDYRGLKPSQWGFNTVDGFYIGQKITYSKSLPKQNRFAIVPEAVWAINRKAVMWNMDASLTYLPMRRASANIRFGQMTRNFDGGTGINAFENTVSSLFFRCNYLKLYENNSVEASNGIDIANGLRLNASLKYARRVMLDNHSDYSVFYRNEREYSPNIPVNTELPDALAPRHTSASFALNLNYTPQFYYRIYDNRKYNVRSDFPTFSAMYQKGVRGVMDSDSNFDHLSLSVWQRLDAGLMQEFRYTVRGGAFINRKSVSFPDFKHFSTVEIPFTINSISGQSFNLLEYYRFSTSDKYAEAHLSYTTPFLILKLLPFFSNRMLWTEGLHFNCLYTPVIKNYVEAGYTIGIPSLWEAGVFVGFGSSTDWRWGVKVSIPVRGL